MSAGRQLSLFADDDIDGVGLDPVESLPPRPELEALARRVRAGVHLGTSSWTFSGWRGIVYRRAYHGQRQFVRFALEEYARHPLMTTVGIDRSYYAPIEADELRRYATQLPPGFPCVMKVWSELTTLVFPRHPRHGDRAGRRNPSFLDRALFRDAVAAPIEAAGFGEHARVLVLEVPGPPNVPDTIGFCAALDRFLSAFAPAFRFAVEVRDPRLLTQRYFHVLRAHGATHVFNFWSRMPPIGDQLRLSGSMPGPFVVARLLIPPGKHYEQLREAYAPFDRLVDEQPAMRRDVVRLVERARERDYPVFILVNNKAEGSSPLTVAALSELLAR